jgi:hypothetical protein
MSSYHIITEDHFVKHVNITGIYNLLCLMQIQKMLKVASLISLAWVWEEGA